MYAYVVLFECVSCVFFAVSVERMYVSVPGESPAGHHRGRERERAREREREKEREMEKERERETGQVAVIFLAAAVCGRRPCGHCPVERRPGEARTRWVRPIFKLRISRILEFGSNEFLNEGGGLS